MKVKALKFTKNHGLHGIHGNGRFSRKTVNFTENVTAVKSWIRLVPSNHWPGQFLTQKDLDSGDRQRSQTSLQSAHSSTTAS